MTGIERIAAERKRQIEVEGFTVDDDRLYSAEPLALAAACYAVPEWNRLYRRGIPMDWPWSVRWWKPTPKNRIRELEKAGALIAAEIDRLQAEQGEG